MPPLLQVYEVQKLIEAEQVAVRQELQGLQRAVAHVSSLLHQLQDGIKQVGAW